MAKYYKHIHWLFIFIAICVPFGFRRYLLSLFGSHKELAVHIHAVLMAAWCVLLIMQPLLIRQKKFKTHRYIGKLSYAIVPLIVLSMLAMIRLSYIRGQEHLTEEQNLDSLLLPVSQLLLFASYYALAMIKRKEVNLHMRFLIISSLTLLGPTIGRFDLSSFAVDLDMVNVSLSVMELLIVLLMILDYYYTKKIKVYLIALILFSLSHYAVYYLGTSYFWQSFAKFITE
ncbi:MAG TPA: hypothetical protein VFR70_05845 [Flavobacterium sp.]|nr:hypothetical protein [Flavobacterium sp.]